MPWGVPFFANDSERLTEKLLEFYDVLSGRDSNQAVRMLLERNEQLVSRCTLLITFSGILITLVTYIGAKPELIPLQWEQVLYYSVLGLWVFTTVGLLADLYHLMPPYEHLGDEQHVRFIARVYVRRLRRYNVALATTIIGFVLMMVMLGPIRTVYTDLLFQTHGTK